MFLQLIEAIKARNIIEAENLIVQMDITELSKVDVNKYTALHWAAQNGKEKVCELLINANPKLLDAVNNNGYTALHNAVWGGNEKICELLINANPKLLDAVDNNGYTALHLATKCGNKKVCELLINANPKLLDAVTNNGYTALHLATINGYTINGYEKICELLINANPKLVDAVDNNGYTALHYAASYGQEKIYELLINANPRLVDNVDNNGYTALHYAANQGKEKVCKLLLSQMSQETINTVDKEGKTALHLAANHTQEKVCELLLSQMSQETINTVDKEGKTALHLAATSGREKICELLINANPKLVDAVDNTGCTALHYAARRGHEKICELLINANPKLLDAVDNKGYTALHSAASSGNEKVCELLLSKMSQETINSINREGKTASELAQTKGYNKIVELITTRLSQIPQEKQQAELLAKQQELEAKKQAELEAKQKQEQEIQQLNKLLSAIQNNQLEDAEDLIRSSNIQILNKIEAALEILTQIQQEKQKMEEIMIHQQTLIQEALELTAKGVDSIKGNIVIRDNRIIEEKHTKGILILGKTGAGKSTLAYLLAGKKLKIKKIESTDQTVFEAEEPNENIVISHTGDSETSIPGKIMGGRDKDIAIWDCPGFMDTTGIPQVIANALYIKQLFTVNSQLKFILAVTEADLTTRSNILPIVRQFIKIFNTTDNDIECLENKVSLIVTNVANGKSLNSIKTSFENFLKCNNKLTNTEKNIRFFSKINPYFQGS